MRIIHASGGKSSRKSKNMGLAENSADNTLDARPTAVIYYPAFKQKGNMNTNLLLNGLLLLALTRRGAVLLV